MPKHALWEVSEVKFRALHTPRTPLCKREFVLTGARPSLRPGTTAARGAASGATQIYKNNKKFSSGNVIRNVFTSGLSNPHSSSSYSLSSPSEKKKTGQSTTVRPLLMKIHQLRSASSENPLNAECLFGKSANCKVLVPMTHHCKFDPKTHPLYSRAKKLQLLDFFLHFAVGGLSEQGLCSWWIFRKSFPQLVVFY